MGSIALDSSVILAVLLPEEDADGYMHILARAESIRLSAINYMESSIVYASRIDPAKAFARVDTLVSGFNILIEPISSGHAELARETFLRFGKGRHPAKLNMGDCFAYALAKTYGVPLLYKGDDFSKTDIKSAL